MESGRDPCVSVLGAAPVSSAGHGAEEEEASHHRKPYWQLQASGVIHPFHVNQQ